MVAEEVHGIATGTVPDCEGAEEEGAMGPWDGRVPRSCAAWQPLLAALPLWK